MQMFNLGKSKSIVINHKLRLWLFSGNCTSWVMQPIKCCWNSTCTTSPRSSNIICVWGEESKQLRIFTPDLWVFKLFSIYGCTFHSTNRFRLLLKDLPMTLAYVVVINFSYLKIIDQNKINKMGKTYSLFLDEADLEISNERPEFHKYQHIVRARLDTEERVFPTLVCSR